MRPIGYLNKTRVDTIYIGSGSDFFYSPAPGIIQTNAQLATDLDVVARRGSGAAQVIMGFINGGAGFAFGGGGAPRLWAPPGGGMILDDVLSLTGSGQLVMTGAVSAIRMIRTGAVVADHSLVSGAQGATEQFGLLHTGGANRYGWYTTSGDVLVAPQGINVPAGIASSFGSISATGNIVTTSGGVSAAGNIATSGQFVGAALSISGAASLASLTVTGAASLGSLSVTGSTTYSGTVTAAGFVAGSGGIIAQGPLGLTVQQGGISVQNGGIGLIHSASGNANNLIVGDRVLVGVGPYPPGNIALSSQNAIQWMDAVSLGPVGSSIALDGANIFTFASIFAAGAAQAYSFYAGSTERLRIWADGSFAFGPAAKPTGAGSINAMEYYRQGTIHDEVFEPGYPILSIPAMRAHYEQHRQLPTLPTAEIHEAGLNNLGALSERLWATVETQAIYIAQLHERLERLEQA